MDLRGRRALVTGASSGIGSAFARQLAKRGAALVLTARRADRLQALAQEIGTDVEVVPLDLSRADAPGQLFDRTEGAGLPVDILVNNAGFGTRHSFAEADWEKIAEEMRLNMISLTELTHRFVRPMLARGTGWILNVASVGAFFPTPRMSTYGAGKSYVKNFSEGLAHELRKTGVRVCALCPGPTESEFTSTAGIELAWWKMPAFMTADRCARIGLRALFRGRRVVVPGYGNSFGVFLTRFLPRRLVTVLADRLL